MNEQEKLEKRRMYDREWKRQERIRDIEKVRARARKNARKLRENPEWVERRKAYMRTYLKKWRKDNERQRIRHREWMRGWYKRNAKEIYQRRHSKIHEKIAANLRRRIYDVLKHNSKSASTEILVGAKVSFVKKYLEKQFKNGMTWDNYGFYGWHIDHRKPLASFDLTNVEEQKKAFHYTNLQPLWAKENIQKGAKMV